MAKLSEPSEDGGAPPAGAAMGAVRTPTLIRMLRCFICLRWVTETL